jgi:magnesium transporter
MADDAGMTVTPMPALRGPKGEIRAEFVKRVEQAIAARDVAALRELGGDLHEADLGDLLEALDPDLRPRLIELMGADFDFTALTEVDDSVREDILEELEPETVAEGVRDLDSDDAVAILEDLPKADQTEILDQLPPPERVALARSLDYPEDSAGRRMQDEFIAVPPFWTVGHAIDYLRDTSDLPGRFFELYVVDGAYHFLGAVTLDRVLRSQRPTPISSLMEEDRHRVRATDDQEEVARLFEHYNLVAVPVVDKDDRLVGVITVDDMVDVISEEAEEDIKALGGVSSGEELSDTVWPIARGRFNWLLVNLATAFLASSVLGLFEGSLEKMVALAVLGRVIVRECLVGLINGLAFAAITGVVAYAWFKVPGLGVVIGLAMVCNLVAGALGGILIPLILDRLKFDPAVSSGAFVTTVTDVVGFFSFLGIATLWFGLS